MTLDTGIYGAKVQSWRTGNYRDLLKRLIDRNPHADEDRLYELWNNKVLASEDILDTVLRYTFANAYRSFSGLTPEERARRSAALAAEREKVKATIQARLLDIVLPNGKKLRDCTFGYCRELGGGLSRIGAKGKPGQIVGKLLSEAEVRKLYK